MSTWGEQKQEFLKFRFYRKRINEDGKTWEWKWTIQLGPLKISYEPWWQKRRLKNLKEFVVIITNAHQSKQYGGFMVFTLIGEIDVQWRNVEAIFKKQSTGDFPHGQR